MARKTTFRLVPCALLGVLISGVSTGNGQSVSNFAVQVWVTLQTNPPVIGVSWVTNSYATDYSVFRRVGVSGTWEQAATLPATASSFNDSNVVAGVAYEYAVYMDATNYFAEGYVYSGIQAPLNENRGKVVLLVDNTQSGPLAFELARLQQDLAGDGWIVLRHDVPRASVSPANTSSSVWTARSNELAAIKALVVADYNSDPTNVNGVLLFGHLPVMYSGELAPDAHPQHIGAWPADAFYGDMLGVWTDSTVSNYTAYDPRNWNVPGDAKADATYIPGNVDLEVGRVDLANLPAFPQSETELLRQYLNKDHNFRYGIVTAQRRGLIDDNFGVIQQSQEAFAVNGWRNFTPLFGPSNIVTGGWLNVPSGQTYLWGYACGPGTFTSAQGVATTADFVTNDTPVIFTMLYGSWFGDWDVQNDFMRAQLATPTYTLTSAWAGRPYWYFHHMGLGETVGFSTRLCQNGEYGVADSVGLYEVHVALMGDPTLRMHPVAPPASLAVVSNGVGGVTLNWKPSPDDMAGYYVYSAATAAGPFTRLTSDLLTASTYTDPLVSSNVYMVRAVKLEQTPSGSYYNASQGIFQSVDGRAGQAQLALYQPTNNALFLGPAVIQFKAGVSDPAGAVTNVAFYANGVKLGDAAAPSYGLVWNGVPGGLYSVTAVACSSVGPMASSGPITVSVDNGGSPRLNIKPAGNGSCIISGDEVLGRTYRIESADNLPATNWQTLGAATGGVSGTFQFLDSPGAGQRFYRTLYP